MDRRSFIAKLRDGIVAASSADADKVVEGVKKLSSLPSSLSSDDAKKVLSAYDCNLGNVYNFVDNKFGICDIDNRHAIVTPDNVAFSARMLLEGDYSQGNKKLLRDAYKNPDVMQAIIVEMERYACGGLGNAISSSWREGFSKGLSFIVESISQGEVGINGYIEKVKVDHQVQIDSYIREKVDGIDIEDVDSKVVIKSFQVKEQFRSGVYIAKFEVCVDESDNVIFSVKPDVSKEDVGQLLRNMQRAINGSGYCNTKVEGRNLIAKDCPDDVLTAIYLASKQVEKEQERSVAKV